MHKPNLPVSLAELSSAGIRLRPCEAATLVRELVMQVARGDVAGVPSPHVIRLSATGAITVEGPVAAGGNPVIRAAQLLDTLLPAGRAGDDFRIPGGLKLVIARALGTLDLPAFPSLDAFADALARFAATDAPAAVAQLVGAWAERSPAQAPEPEIATAPPVAATVEPFVDLREPTPGMPGENVSLTVSDIRRARRATGMPLGEVAERSRIPLTLLRQLEWGYLMNWPGGQYGRTQLVRYARATGLDEQLVVSTIMPLLAESTIAKGSLSPRFPAPTAHAGTALLPVHEQGLALRSQAAGYPIPVAAEPDVTPSARRRRSAALAALAIPALLAIGLLPAWWLGGREPLLSETGAVSSATPRGSAAADSNAASPPEAPAPHARSEGNTAGRETASGRRSSGAGPAVPVEPGAGSGRANDEAARIGTGGQPVPAAPPARNVAQAQEARPGLVQAAHRLSAADEEYSPSFAAVGTAMFYHAQEEGRAALVRADTDSRGAVLRVTRIVDDNAQNFHVRPSPDGTRIAFDSDRDGERGVYVADADGRNVRRVSPEGYAAVPSWSPDGRTLAFLRAEPDRPKVWNLWTLQLETGQLQQITRHRYGQVWGGSWFPDGRRLAYSHEKRLVIHDLRTGGERVFPSPRRGRLARTPAVSPDGRQIVFQVQHDGTWLLDTSNGAMRKVLEDPTAEEYAWSPDGRQVAYHSRKAGGWGVWVMAPR